LGSEGVLLEHRGKKNGLLQRAESCNGFVDRDEWEEEASLLRRRMWRIEKKGLRDRLAAEMLLLQPTAIFYADVLLR